MKNSRRILSLLLCFAMVLSMIGSTGMPVSAKDLGGNVFKYASATDATSTDASTENADSEEGTSEESTEETEATADPEGDEESGDTYFEGDLDSALNTKKTSAEAFGKFTLAAAPKLAAAPINGYVDYSDYLTSHKLIHNGKTLVDGDLVIPSKNFELELSFRLKLGEMNSVKYYYRLPEHVGVGDQGSEESPITLYNSSHVPIGTYYIKDNIIFIDYPGYYEDVYTNFAMEGSWDGIDNLLSFQIEWPKETETYNLNPSEVTVTKNKNDYVTQDDGSLLCTYKVKIAPNTADTPVNDVKLTDTFNVNRLKVVEDYFGTESAYKLSIYDATGSVVSETLYKFSDIATVSSTGGSISAVVEDIDIPANGYALFSYAASIPVADRMEMDGTNSVDSYTNKVRASYTVIDTTDGSTKELYSEATVTGNYSNKGEWIYKEAGDPEKTRVIDSKEYVVVPYAITINKHRYYSLGGSVVHDTITGFLGGTVKYDTSSSATTEVEVIDKDHPNGGKVTQKWVTLTAAEYEALSACVNRSGSDTALSRLNDDASVLSIVTSAINSQYSQSLTSLTDEAALKYVFTTDSANDFIWLMPHDNEPTSYMIHYDTIAEQTVGSFSNSASMWYTDMEGVPYGPGIGYVSPVKKVLTATKHNEGVYIGSDGNYYVDYTLTVGLPANSGGFDKTALYDYFPSRTVSIDGKDVVVGDWLVGLSEYSLQSNPYDSLNSCFTITTDSDRADVQAVANGAYVIPWNGSGGGNHYTGGSSNWKKEFGEVDCFESAIDNAQYYSGTDMAAGQLIAGRKYDEVKKGSTYTLYDIAIYLGELPDTVGKDGYNITIKYSMMVNPVLIEKLADEIKEEKESTGKEYIVQENTATVNTEYVPYWTDGWAISPLSSVISNLSSSYWLGTGETVPGIEKKIPDNGYNDSAQTLSYEVTVAPEGGKAEADKYVVSDQLNISGMKYVNGSFELKDGNTVIWSDTSGAATAYAGKISFSKTAETSKSNGFELILNNDTGLFQQSDNNFKKLTLTYKVDVSGYETDLTIENTVGLSKVLYDGDGNEKGRDRLGEDTTEYAIDKALDKKLITTPSSSNNYTGKFLIDINPESDNAKELKQLVTGDTFTVKDTFGVDLTLDVDDVKVTEVTSSGTEKDITGNCILRYSTDSNVFEAILTYTDGSKYKIEYSAKVAGREGRTSVMENDVEIPGTTVKADSIRERIYVYSYSGNADANVYSIKFEKFDVNHIDHKIAGARFELYRYNTDSSSWEEVTDGQDDRPDYIETDSNGKVTVNNSSLVSTTPKKLIQMGYYYKLVEIQTEEGYVLDKTPIYYYVYNNDVDSAGNPVAQTTAPSDVSKAGYENVVLTSLGKEDFIPLVLVGNSKFNFEIEKINGSTGSILSGSEFTLYSDDACTNVIAVATDDDGDGRLSFEDIPNISTTNGTYYLKETKVPTDYADRDEVFTLSLKDGYINSITGSKGTVVKIDNSGRKSLITVPNSSSKETYLKITKTVIPSGYSSDSFSFSIILSDENDNRLTGSYPATITRNDGSKENITFKNNNVIFLAGNEEILFTSLPDGTKYTVSETVDNNYITNVQVNDSAGTDYSYKKIGRTASGSLETGEQDEVAFSNSKLRDITITKQCVDQNGGKLGIPDGLKLEISSNSGTKEVEAEWDSSIDKFVLTYRRSSSYKFDNSVDSGFHVSSLPIDEYYIYEYDADINGYFCSLKYSKNGNSSYYTDIPTAGAESVGGSTTVSLVNTYTRDSFNTSFKANKVFEGKTLTSGEFSFELLYLGKNISSTRNLGSERVIDTQKCDASGNVQFDIDYPKLDESVGKYYYLIREVIPEGAVNGIYNNIRYSGSSYYVRVDIVKDKTTGVISISEPKYMTEFSYAENPETITEDAVKFTNEYIAAEGSWTPAFTKTLTGRDSSAGEFTFKLAQVESDYTTPVKDASGKDIVYSASSPALSDGVQASASFADINYDENDIGKTYYYVMYEDIPSGAVGGVYKGVTYDRRQTKYSVTITRTDNRTASGKYELDIDVVRYESLPNFVNTYNASVQVPLPGSKKLYGRDIQNYEFNFMASLYVDGTAVAGNTDIWFGYAGTDGKIYNSAGLENSLVLDQSYVGKQVKVYVWEYIPFSTNDPYYNPGVTYDQNIIVANIDVSDNGDGTLSADVNYTDYLGNPLSGIDYENEYSSNASLTFTAGKLLKGNDLEKGKFTFEIYEGNTLVSTGTNDENGVITFDPIDYYIVGTKNGITDNTGEHTYTIKEVIPAGVDNNLTLDGVTYDDTEYEVKVKAEDDMWGGMNLTVTGAALDAAGLTYTVELPTDRSDTFINSYNAVGDITLTGSKVLTGRTLDDGEFTFNVVEEKYDAVSGEYQATGRTFAGANNVDGDIIFDTIDYAKNENQDDTGTYRYIVTENIPDAASARGGVTYDDTSYTLTVKVMDNGDGTLTAYEAMENPQIVFNNEYKATGKLDINVKKLAVTDNTEEYSDTLADGTSVGNTFDIEISEILPVTETDASGNTVVVGEKAVTISEKTLKVGESVLVPVDEYDLTDVGIHHYKVVEKTGTAPGYTYDDTEFGITTKVVDGREGILLVYLERGILDDIDVNATEPTFILFDDGNALDDVTFTNTYAASGEVSLEVTKKVQNIELTYDKAEFNAGMFTFKLSEYDAASGEFVEIDTVTNNAYGNAIFNTIEYQMKDVGTHIYKIEEDKENQLSTILYNAGDVYAVVNVSNNGDGTLGVVTSYSYESDVEKLSAGEYDAVSDPVMENAVTTTTISKVKKDGTGLSGASLEILDEKGKVVYTFTSEATAHRVYGLEKEKKYTLRETKAPAGYEVASDVVFKIGSDGKTYILSGLENVAAESVIMVDLPVTETDSTTETKTETGSTSDKKPSVGTGTSSRTSDSMHLIPVLILMLLSLGGAALIVVRKRKHKD